MNKVSKLIGVCVLVSSLVVPSVQAETTYTTSYEQRSASVIDRPNYASANSIGEIKVLVTNLNLRTAPNLSSSIVKTLPINSAWAVLEEKDGFYKLGNNQWVTAGSQYVAFTKYRDKQIGVVTVKTPVAQLRNAATWDTSSIVRTLSQNSSWKTFKTANGFYNLGGNQWVAGSQVTYTPMGTNPNPIPETPSNIGTIETKQALNVRKDSNWTSPTVRAIPKGTKITAYKQENGFFNIGTNEWVPSGNDFAVLVNGGTGGGTTTPPVTPPTTGIGTIEAKQALNVRKSSSWSAASVRTIQKGTKLTAYKQENGFYNIGTNEWVPSGNEFAVPVNGGTGGGTTTPPVTPPVNQEIGTVEILISDLQLRTGPGTNYSVVKKMNKGSQWKVFKKQNDFYNLGGDQWISANPNYVRFTDKNGNVTEPPASSNAEKLINFAKQYLGVPYVWGGSSPSGFDCSGYIYYVYKNNGFPSMGRDTVEGYWGNVKRLSAPQPGDLVFFKDTYSPGYDYGGPFPSHMGIVIDNQGNFIQASGTKVNISNYKTNSFWSSHFLGFGKF